MNDGQYSKKHRKQYMNLYLKYRDDPLYLYEKCVASYKIRTPPPPPPNVVISPCSSMEGEYPATQSGPRPPPNHLPEM